MIEFASPRKRTRLGVSRSEEAHDRWRDTEHSRDDTEFVVIEFDEPRALGRGEDGGLVEYGGRRSRRRRGVRLRPARRRSSRATLRHGSRASRGRTRSHAPVVSRSGSGARRSHAAESPPGLGVRARKSIEVIATGARGRDFWLRRPYEHRAQTYGFVGAREGRESTHGEEVVAPKASRSYK